jgi:hypothetical protein
MPAAVRCCKGSKYEEPIDCRLFAPMISKTQVIPMLLEACPSFRTAWDEHRTEYGDDLLYVALGDFARHLLHLHQHDQTESFTAVAGVVERFHIEGDGDVQEAATIGLLEAIQNNWEHNNTDTELFASRLLPESRKWWDELTAFWRGERRYVGEGLMMSENRGGGKAEKQL